MELARPARPADRPACTRLLAQALAEVASMRGGAALAGEATPGTLVERWSAPDEAQLWVGEYEGVVVGLAAATVGGGPSGRRGLVECCYVERAARAVGVGSALLDTAVAWCASRDVGEVDALALPGDRATKARLEAAGFTARLLTLSRPLG